MAYGLYYLTYLRTNLRNPLTLHIESWLGSVFIIALSLFFVGLLFIAVKNFDSDNRILNANSTKVKSVSAQERRLIDEWLGRNQIELSVGEAGYRNIVKKYPDKPWIAE